MGYQFVLLVDNDHSIQRLLQAALTMRGYSVVVTGTANGALKALDRYHPDLILLDIMLPDCSGFGILQEIRARTCVPLIVISARGAPEDRAQGLELGADDYVTKPFHLDELLARITAVLRRVCTNAPPPTPLYYGHVTIDLHNRRVYVDGEEVRLSRTEWALLEQLARNPGRVMRHAELLSHVWGPEFARETYYLRTWVSRLRAKLRDEEPHRVIVTRPGLGYQLADPLAVPA